MSQMIGKEDSSQSNSPETDVTGPEERAEKLPPVGLLDYVIFPLFVLSFVGVLVVFELFQRISYLFGLRAHQRCVRLLNYMLVACLRLCRTKISVKWKTAIDPSQTYVVLSNHQSLFDLPILDTTLAALNPRYISKQELGRGIPSVSFNLRHGGSALIDRSDARQSIPAIRELGKRMAEQGFSAVIFPEGTRARWGVLKPFRAGGINALLEGDPKARILPVVLDGTWKLSSRKYGPIPCGVDVLVSVLPEIPREDKSTKTLVSEAYTSVEKELTDMRASRKT